MQFYLEVEFFKASPWKGFGENIDNLQFSRNAGQLDYPIVGLLGDEMPIYLNPVAACHDDLDSWLYL